MEKDFIIEAESMKYPEKREQIRLSEEKLKELKGVIQRLGNDLDQLELKKDLLIIENNKLRGLLKECLAHLSFGKIGTSVTPVNILLARINAAIGESEE